MKTLIITLMLFLSGISLSTISIVDNRDYPEDGYEIYVLDTHVGYYYADDMEIEIVITGK